VRSQEELLGASPLALMPRAGRSAEAERASRQVLRPAQHGAWLLVLEQAQVLRPEQQQQAPGLRQAWEPRRVPTR